MLNVVYIDDEPDFCILFRELFENDDYNISTFIDCTTACKSIFENKPDLIFIDYRMPKTNGDIVSASIDSKIPKVLITGELNINPTYPFYRILHKPYSHDEVRQILKTFYLKTI